MVDNAIHALAGQDGGKIEVTVSCDEEHWTLVVTDNGPGISIGQTSTAIVTSATERP